MERLGDVRQLQNSRATSATLGNLPGFLVHSLPEGALATRAAALPVLNDGAHMRAGETISVAILDDNRLLRDGLSAMLNKLPDIRVVASAPSYSPSLAETPADVLLLDVGLLEHESLRLATALRGEMPETKIIVMDLMPVHEEIMDFVNAGVSGFVLKDATSTSSSRRSAPSPQVKKSCRPA